MDAAHGDDGDGRQERRRVGGGAVPDPAGRRERAPGGGERAAPGTGTGRLADGVGEAAELAGAACDGRGD
eukprot:3081869-Prymnesium_polylepis.1